MGLPAGASLAFFMASSNFFARMSSLLVSWNQESANLSSRCRFCSARIFCASVRSTFGPALGGASCESTAPKTGSTTSLAWQHGQVTCRFSPSFNPMPVLYASTHKKVGARARDLDARARLTQRVRRRSMRRRMWVRRWLMTLKGKYALVTGGSRGIGRGIALKLAECGAKVAVHYNQKEDQANATLERIRGCGSGGFVVQADVTRAEEIQRMFARVKSEFGVLDIFVNNARPEIPTFYEGPMAIGLDKFDFAMNSQAKAFLTSVQEAVPMMRDGGRIIAMTYAPGGRFGGWQPWVAMGAAKAALEVLCRYFAVALGPREITVNAVSPGWTEDTVFNTLPDAVQNTIRNWHQEGWTPMRRLGTTTDIGNAVALLCMPEASWITGQVLDVDGGASLMDAHLPLEIQQIPQ